MILPILCLLNVRHAYRDGMRCELWLTIKFLPCSSPVFNMIIRQIHLHYWNASRINSFFFCFVFVLAHPKTLFLHFGQFRISFQASVTFYLLFRFKEFSFDCDITSFGHLNFMKKLSVGGFVEKTIWIYGVTSTKLECSRHALQISCFTFHDFSQNRSIYRVQTFFSIRTWPVWIKDW